MTDTEVKTVTGETRTLKFCKVVTNNSRGPDMNVYSSCIYSSFTKTHKCEP